MPSTQTIGIRALACALLALGLLLTGQAVASNKSECSAYCTRFMKTHPGRYCKVNKGNGCWGQRWKRIKKCGGWGWNYAVCEDVNRRNRLECQRACDAFKKKTPGVECKVRDKNVCWGRDWVKLKHCGGAGENHSACYNASKLNKVACQKHCDSYMRKHPGSVCKVRDKNVCWGLDWAQIKHCGGKGENYSACVDASKENKAECQRACDDYKKKHPRVECKVRDKNVCWGLDWVRIKHCGGKGENYAACRNVSTERKLACEAYCKRTKDCAKCWPKIGCGFGFKRMKTFGGRGDNWYACRQRRPVAHSEYGNFVFHKPMPLESELGDVNTKDFQGIANDGNYWYFSNFTQIFKCKGDDMSSCVKRISTTDGFGRVGRLKSKVLPAELRGYDHWCDMDFHQGKLYAPIFKQDSNKKAALVIFDAQLQYKRHAFFPKERGTLGWIAVHPKNGKFFTTSKKDFKTLSVWDWDKKNPEMLTKVGEVALDFGSYAQGTKDWWNKAWAQGGDFGPDGMLYVVLDHAKEEYSKYSGVYSFELTLSEEKDGRVSGTGQAKGLANLRYHASTPRKGWRRNEIEGLTYWRRGNGKYPGEVHVPYVDRDPGQEDITVFHYSIKR